MNSRFMIKRVAGRIKRFAKRIKGYLYRTLFIIKNHRRSALLCVGNGVEVGAMCKPAKLPKATSILYADIGTSDEIRQSIEETGYTGYRGEYPEVSIVFPPDRPPLESIKSSSLDFVYSSHSLEHSPNPVGALVDYLRVVKKGGIVYTLIPNKRHTFDNKRQVTPPSILIKKFRENIWKYTLKEYEDVYLNTDYYFQSPYLGKSKKDARIAFESESLSHKGGHHIHVFDELNTLSIIQFVTDHSGARLLYFDLEGNSIIFAIQKK